MKFSDHHENGMDMGAGGYLWCQQQLTAANSLRDCDSASVATDSFRHNRPHHRCCLLADRLCTANHAEPGLSAAAVV